MGKIYIVPLFIFVLNVSFGIEVGVGVNQYQRWAEVKGMEPYELLSDALSILVELLLYVCTTINKLFIILVCMIITCIDLFTKILVVSVQYVEQSSSGVLEMLIWGLQDLFTLVEAILIMMQQTVSSHYCNKGVQQPMWVLPTLVILFSSWCRKVLILFSPCNWNILTVCTNPIFFSKLYHVEVDLKFKFYLISPSMNEVIVSINFLLSAKINLIVILNNYFIFIIVFS